MLPIFWPRTTGVKRPDSVWISIVAGTVAGVMLPILLVLLGWLLQILVQAPYGLPSRVSVGPLGIETAWLNAGESSLRAAIGLLVLIMIAALLCGSAITVNYRTAALSAIDFHVQVQRLLFHKSNALAIEQGLSGQLSSLHRIQQKNIPKARDVILQWYSAFPRHVIYLVCLVVLALAIHPWLTILFGVCLGILRALQNYLDTSWRKRLPVLLERARSTTQQLSYLCDTAPLLATVHDQQDTESGYDAQLTALRLSSIQLIHPGPWRSPILLVVGTVFATLIAAIVAIRLVDPTHSLQFGEAIILGTTMLCVVSSISKLAATVSAIRGSESAFNAIFEYLHQPTLEQGDDRKSEPKRIATGLSLEHVTLKDSSGQKLLEDISLVLKPGQLTAILASDVVQANALAELLLGFGRPTSGRLLIDSVDSIDLNRNAIRNLSLWINPTGPLVNGSIESNLWPDGHSNATVDLMEIVKRVHVSEAVLNLADGMSTLVTPGDDRLHPDQLFRLGIARGLVKKPSIAIAEEPKGRVKPSTENDTLDALTKLKKQGSIVLLLPNRPASLRIADQVIVLHEHRVAAIGTHAQLLEQSELYRHLNYIRFTEF